MSDCVSIGPPMCVCKVRRMISPAPLADFYVPTLLDPESFLICPMGGGAHEDRGGLENGCFD